MTKDKLREAYLKAVPMMIANGNQITYTDWLEKKLEGVTGSGEERLETFIQVKVRVDKQLKFHQSKGNMDKAEATKSISGMIQNMINDERGFEFPQQKDNAEIYSRS